MNEDVGNEDVGMAERRRLAAILGAVLAVVAVALYLALSVRPPVVSGQPAAAAVPAKATPKPVPSTTAPPRDYVAQAAPTSFEITGRAFTVRAHVCRMPYV